MKKMLAIIFVLFSVIANTHALTADDYFSEANAYYENGDYENALVFYEKALELFRETVGENHLGTGASYNGIGIIYYYKGNLDKALEYLSKAMDIQIKILGDDNPDVLASYNNIARVYRDKGDLDHALYYYIKSLEIQKKFLGDNHIDIAKKYSDIGLIYAQKGDYANSISSYEKGLDISRILLGEKDSFTATLYASLGGVYFSKGEINECLSYYIKAITVWEENADSNDSLLSVYRIIGTAYYNQSDYSNALFYWEKELAKAESNGFIPVGVYSNIAHVYDSLDDKNSALEYAKKECDVRKKLLGEGNIETVRSYFDVACLYRLTMEFREALSYYEKALNGYKSILGENNQYVSDVYYDIGCIYYAKNDYEKSIVHYMKALAIQTKTLGFWNSATAETYDKLAYVYFDIGDYDKSLECHVNALEINRKVLGEMNQTTARNYNDVGFLYYSKGDYDKALEYYDRVINIYKELFGEDNKASATTYDNMGLAYKYKGDYSSALKYYRKCLSMVEADRSSSTVHAYVNLGSLLRDYGDVKMGLEYLLKALDLSKSVNGKLDVETALVFNAIGLCYSRLDDSDKALMYVQQALDIYKSIPRLEEHPDTAAFLKYIGSEYLKKKDLKSAVSSWNDARRVMLKASAYDMTIDLLKQMLFSRIPDTAFLRETLVQVTDTVERARLDMTSMKGNLLKESLPVYYFGVGFEAQNGNPEKAFKYSEALRSRGFLDQLGTEAALKLNGVTDTERGQVRELVVRISESRKELEQQGSLPKGKRDEALYKNAGDELARAEKELAKLDDAIGKRLPAYAQLRNPKPVDVKSAQKWCGKKRAVLEYVLPDPELNIGSWCIVVTENKVEAVSLDGRYDYTDAVDRLRKGVSDGLYEDQFEKPRNELYDKLLAPVLAKLGKDVKELVIVPDGNLAFLPFDILRKDAVSACLGDRYPVTFSPSVSVSVLSSESGHTECKVLAFGGAWYDSSLTD